MMLALLTLTIFTIMAVHFLRSSQSWGLESEVEKSRQLHSVRAKNGAQEVHSAVAALMNSLLVDPAGPSGAHATDSISDPSIYQNIVQVPPSSNNDNAATTELYRVDCYEQGSPATFPCTKDMTVLPKFFKSTYKILDQKNGMITTVHENFEINASTFNQFALFVSQQCGAANFGDAEFTGDIGILFEDPTKCAPWNPAAFQPSMNFLYVPNAHAQFDGNVYTTLPNQTSITVQPQAQDPVFAKGVNWNSSGIQNALVEALSDAKTAAIQQNNYQDPMATNATGDPTNPYKYCDPSLGPRYCRAVTTSEVDLGSPSDPCFVNAEQTVTWKSYQCIDGSGNPTGYCDGVCPRCSMVSLSPTITQTIFKGVPPDDNQTYYLNGSLSMNGPPNNNHQMSVCHSALIAGSGYIYLNGGIQKAPNYTDDSQANLALMANGNIVLSQNAYLADGSVIQDYYKNSISTPPSTPFQIDASLIAVGSGSLYSGILDLTSVRQAATEDKAENFGDFNYRGMLETSQSVTPHQVWPDGTLDGFHKMTISTNPQLKFHPPPGMSFKVNVGYVAVVTGFSETDYSFNEAAASMASP